MANEQLAFQFLTLTPKCTTGNSMYKQKRNACAVSKQSINSLLQLTPVVSAMQLCVLGLGAGLVNERICAATLIINSNSVGLDSFNSTTECTLSNAISSINQQALQPGCLGFANSDPFGTNDTILSYSSQILGGDTITLSGDGRFLVAAGRDITIEGSGVGDNGLNINHSSGVFYLSSSATLTLSNISITGGGDTSRAPIVIRSSSNLTLNNTTVSGNSTTGTTGGISSIGGSTVTLNNSVVSNNSGKGISSNGAGSVLTLNNSTVSGNSIRPSGGVNSSVFNGAGLNIGDTILSINNSTISGNSASRSGGGISASTSTITLNNSTISGNFAEQEGGGVDLYRTTATFVNSTIFSNTATTAGSGAGIYSSRTNVQLNNTILAGSVVGSDCKIGIAGTFQSDTASIIQDGSCNTAARDVAPRLEPLADNGGDTQTHALLGNSPARNTGDLLTCTELDQVGSLRTSGDGRCDVGALEFIEAESSCFVVKAANGNVMTFCL